MVSMTEEFIGTAEIAQRLGVTRQTVVTLLRRGKLPGVKLGKSWFVRREDFERAIQAAANPVHVGRPDPLAPINEVLADTDRE
jgi:excisionase family DNA binding protein